jgi:hypothetical protein
MIQGIDHLNVVVGDMARSLAFYTGVLGGVKTKEARLTGEWIERIVGLKGVQAHAVFVELPGGGRGSSCCATRRRRESEWRKIPGRTRRGCAISRCG